VGCEASQTVGNILSPSPPSFWPKRDKTQSMNDLASAWHDLSRVQTLGLLEQIREARMESGYM
jgi:hypothetical protein